MREGSVHIDCFGAVPNSGNDSSLAIQQAIDYCVANRISTVRITGVNTYKIVKPIVIKSNVRLELDPTVTRKLMGILMRLSYKVTLRLLVVLFKL